MSLALLCDDTPALAIPSHVLQRAPAHHICSSSLPCSWSASSALKATLLCGPRRHLACHPHGEAAHTVVSVTPSTTSGHHSTSLTACSSPNSDLTAPPSRSVQLRLGARPEVLRSLLLVPAFLNTGCPTVASALCCSSCSGEVTQFPGLSHKHQSHLRSDWWTQM